MLTHVDTHVSTHEASTHEDIYVSTCVVPSTGVAIYVTTCEVFLRCVLKCGTPRGLHRDWGSICEKHIKYKLLSQLHKSELYKCES